MKEFCDGKTYQGVTGKGNSTESTDRVLTWGRNRKIHHKNYKIQNKKKTMFF